MQSIRLTPRGNIDQIHAALVISTCTHNGGKHEAIHQAPIRCSVFGTFSPAIVKCKNCEIHLPDDFID